MVDPCLGYFSPKYEDKKAHGQLYDAAGVGPRDSKEISDDITTQPQLMNRISEYSLGAFVGNQLMSDI